MKRLLAPSLALALALVAGCSDSRARLGIDVRTDAVPGIEFLSVETEVFRGASLDQGLPAARFATAVSPLGVAFGRGRRVASFEGLPHGSYTVRVRLLRGDGRTPLLSRRVLLDLRGDRVLTITLDRGCLDVECPGEGGAAGQTECVGGRCVEPSCVPPDPTGCEGLVLCGPGVPCAVATSSCAEAACVEGVCLALPIEGACESSDYCLPGEGGGCFTPGEGVESICNTICTSGVETGCETGYWNCSRGEPFCDPFLRRPVGEVCEGGVCDGAGRCVDCAEDAGCSVGCARGAYRCDAAGGGARCELDGSLAAAGTRCAMDGGTCVDGEPCATDGLCTEGGECVADGTPGVIVGPSRALETSESGDTDELTIQLATEPLHDVTIDLTTDEPGEVALDPASIVISPGTGTMPRVITVRGLDDGVVDGDRAFAVRFAVASADARYEAIAVPDANGVNLALVVSCSDGTADCDGLTSNACEADLGSDATCGGCDVTCAGAVANGVEGCAGVGCALSCDAGFGDCDVTTATGCETDVLTSLDHCGGCDQPCAHANALSTCEAGLCEMGICSRGFADCDRDETTGCEANVLTSPDHCGGCDNACRPFPNASPACAGAQCALGRCDDGYLDCNRAPKDGCELRVGGPCDPQDFPCFDTAVACSTEYARPTCERGAQRPAGTSCLDTGVCDDAGECMCTGRWIVGQACGPEHVCNAEGVCARNVFWATVDCASGRGTGMLTGDQICQLRGYAGARVANGWWWRACGGPNGGTGGVDTCVRYDAAGTRCLSFCEPDGPNVDCTGADLCGGGAPALTERLGDGSTEFRAAEFASCGEGNPGWSVRVECAL